MHRKTEVTWERTPPQPAALTGVWGRHRMTASGYQLTLQFKGRSFAEVVALSVFQASCACTVMVRACFPPTLPCCACCGVLRV